jgi:hypothetical protein
VGSWGSGGNASRWGIIAGDAVAVGDPAKLAEERRDDSASGEEGPVFDTERRDATDGRFSREGVDLRRSSRSELELGVRRGAGVFATVVRGVASSGDKREGDEGRGVAAAFARVRRFKESVRSQWD